MWPFHDDRKHFTPCEDDGDWDGEPWDEDAPGHPEATIPAAVGWEGEAQPVSYHCLCNRSSATLFVCACDCVQSFIRLDIQGD